MTTTREPRITIGRLGNGTAYLNGLVSRAALCSRGGSACR